MDPPHRHPHATDPHPHTVSHGSKETDGGGLAEGRPKRGIASLSIPDEEEGSGSGHTSKLQKMGGGCVSPDGLHEGLDLMSPRVPLHKVPHTPTASTPTTRTPSMSTPTTRTPSMSTQHQHAPKPPTTAVPKNLFPSPPAASSTSTTAVPSPPAASSTSTTAVPSPPAASSTSTTAVPSPPAASSTSTTAVPSPPAASSTNADNRLPCAEREGLPHTTSPSSASLSEHNLSDCHLTPDRGEDGGNSSSGKGDATFFKSNHPQHSPSGQHDTHKQRQQSSSSRPSLGPIHPPYPGDAEVMSRVLVAVKEMSNDKDSRIEVNLGLLTDTVTGQRVSFSKDSHRGRNEFVLKRGGRHYFNRCIPVKLFKHLNQHFNQMVVTGGGAVTYSHPPTKWEGVYDDGHVLVRDNRGRAVGAYAERHFKDVQVHSPNTAMDYSVNTLAREKLSDFQDLIHAKPQSVFERDTLHYTKGAWTYSLTTVKNYEKRAQKTIQPHQITYEFNISCNIMKSVREAASSDDTAISALMKEFLYYVRTYAIVLK